MFQVGKLLKKDRIELTTFRINLHGKMLTAWPTAGRVPQTLPESIHEYDLPASPPSHKYEPFLIIPYPFQI